MRKKQETLKNQTRKPKRRKPRQTENFTENYEHKKTFYLERGKKGPVGIYCDNLRSFGERERKLVTGILQPKDFLRRVYLPI